MGYQVEARCHECGSSFTIDYDGGMFFHLVRCDRCGKTKSIAFAELGVLHLGYLKGLSGHYIIASEKHNKKLREHSHVEPISEDEYHRAVEATAGTCRCGGNYYFDAPPRCPNCRSTQIEEGEVTDIYD